MKILGNDFEIKTGLRAMIIWESITDKAFEIKGLFDLYVYLYCSIIAVKGQNLDFNDFIDYCDEHSEVMEEFNEIIRKENERKNIVVKKKQVTKKAKN